MFSLLISQIFIKSIGLIYKLYLTNKDGFGDSGNAIYSSGFQIYALLLTFSSTGVPNAISKLVSARLAIGDTKGAHSIFKIALITFAFVGLIGSTVLFITAKTIANDWIQIPEAEYSLIALSPSVFFVSIIAVMRGYFNGRQTFSVMAKSQSIEQILKTIITILIVEFIILFRGKNTIFMAAGANLATTIATMFSFIYIFFYYTGKRKEIALEISQSVNHKVTRIRKTIKEIITVAFPISLSSLISSFNKNIDSFTIVRFLKKFISEEEAKKQYGILSGKIDSLCALSLSLNVAFVTTLVPSISKSIAKNNYLEAKNKAQLFLRMSLVTGIPMMAVMYLFSGEILNVLFPNASEGFVYLKISSFAILFMLLSQTINAILQGIGKVNVPAMAWGIGMVIKFMCNVLLIPVRQIGITGAIIGNILCNLTATIIGFLVLNKNLKIKIDIYKSLFNPVVATFCMSTVVKLIYNNLRCINFNRMSIIIALMVGTMVYIIIVFMLRTFSKDELKAFIKK